MGDAAVAFVQGDAFSYVPDGPVDWMVSDVVAYPDRIVELLRVWCGARWAARLVVTMKFQGGEPAWDALELAVRSAEERGYHCRAKHAFNNKNELTLMLKRI